MFGTILSSSPDKLQHVCQSENPVSLDYNCLLVLLLSGSASTHTTTPIHDDLQVQLVNLTLYLTLHLKERIAVRTISGIETNCVCVDSPVSVSFKGEEERNDSSQWEGIRRRLPSSRRLPRVEGRQLPPL